MLTDTVIEMAGARRRFDYLPVSLFGSVMGLSGLCAAWRLSHLHFGTPAWIGDLIGVVAVSTFVALAVAYAWKWVDAPQSVKAEFDHPIAGNLFGTFFVSCLVLPMVIAPVSLLGARILWALGATGIVLFAWVVANRWLSNLQETVNVTPS